MQNNFTQNLKKFSTRVKIITVLIFTLSLYQTSIAQNYTPNTFTDPVITTLNNATGAINGGATISLRSALMAADNLGGTHIVTLSTGTYDLTQALPNREITIGNTSQNITINGNGPANTIINMVNDGGQDRILFINPSGTTNSPVITVSGIKFQNGFLSSDPYGGAAICAGGGSAESLTITNCTFDNNHDPAGSFGGGAVCMQVRGNLSIDNSTFTNNASVGSDGGAVLFIVFGSAVGTGFGALSVTNSTFSGNSVNISGPTTANGGALSFSGQGGVTPFSVTITKNTFINNSADGLGGAIVANNSANLNIPAINYNRFVGNTAATSAASGALHFVESSGSVNADNNWWGCNSGPGGTPCDRAGGDVAGGGALTLANWLQLKTSATPTTLCPTNVGPGNTSLVTASFLNNSAGTAVPLANLTRVIGLPVTFTPTLGTLSSADPTIQSSGNAQVTFTSNGTPGNGAVLAQVDNIPASDAIAKAAITILTPASVLTNPSSAAICLGNNTNFVAAFNGIPTPTLQWQVSTDGGATFNNIAGATSSPLVFAVAVGDNGKQFRCVGTNTCAIATTTAATLTVNVAPAVTTNPTDVTLCAPATATFTTAFSGTPVPTVQWQVSTDGGATFNNIAGATSTTLSFATTGADNGKKYRCVGTNTCGSATTTAATLTVNVAPAVTTNPSNQTLCAGATATFIAAFSGSPAPTVQWQISTDGGATFSNIAGATSATLSFSSVAGQNGNQFRCVGTNLCGSATTTAATLTVNVAPAVTTNPTDVTLCAPATATFTAAFSGTPVPTVQWQVSTDGGATFNNIAGATSTTLSFATTGADNGKKYRCVGTNTCGSATTTAATLTVNVASAVTTNPSNQTLCAGATATFIAAFSGSPAPTVQWQISTDGGATFSNIAGATSATLSFSSVAGQNGNQFRCVGTNVCGSATTTAATLTVNVAPAVTTNPTDVTLCAPATATFTTAFSGTPVPTVQWQVSTDGGATFNNIAGATSTTLSFATTGADNGKKYRCVGTNTCGSATTTAATLTVNVAPAVTTNPSNQTLCAGATATFIAAFSGSPAPTVQWQISTDGGATFSNIAGATSATLSFSSVAGQNGNQFRCVGTNLCGSATTTAATLTVNVAPAVTTNPIDQTVPPGNTVTFTAAFSGTPVPTVQWQVSTDGGATFNNIAGATSTTLSFTVALSDNGNKYRCVATNTCGSATTTAATLTATVPPAITANPADLTVCAGSTATFIVTASGVPAPTYQWQISTDGGATFSNIAGATSATLSFSSLLSQSGNKFRCVATNIAGNATSTAATLTVNPVPTVNAVANQVVCNATSTAAVTFSGAVPTAVYNWTNSAPSIGLAASGTGNIASFTATNATGAAIVANIQVTPSYTNAGVTCTGTPITFTITVNPTPTVNTVANQTICNGANTTLITFSGTVATAVYTWTNNTPSIGLAAGGTGNIAAFTGTNATTAPVTATIQVTPSFTNAGVTCTGTPKTFTITVNPTATVNAVANQVVCNGTSTTAVTFSSPTTGGSIVYNWTNNTPSIGLAASGSGNIASFTGTNATNAPVTATITVTPAFTNGVTCNGTPITFTIIVNPTATITAVPNQVLCNGALSTAINFSSPTTGGSIVYNWTNSAPSIGIAATGSGNIASFTAINTGTSPVIATIVVTPSYTNAGVTCVGTPITFTITVNPPPVMNTPASQVVCNNSSTSAVTFTTPVSGGTIVYNWNNNTPSIGLAASGTGNIASFVATNATSAPVIATITATMSYTNGGVTCVSLPVSFTITVNPTATVTAVPNQVVCNNSPTAVINFTSPTTGGSIVYNWTNNTTSIGLAAGGTGNIPSFTGTNVTNAPVTATITVTPSYTNGGVTCIGTPRTFTITVNPTATINAVANQIVCNNTSTAAINFSSPTIGGSIVYNWVNNTPSIGLAATGAGNIAAFTGTNATNAPLTATITVTPAYTNGGVTCNGTPITFTITVNPTAIVNAVANQTVCDGSLTAAVNFSSPTTGGTIVYNWTNSASSIGLAASGSGNIAAFAATNASNAPVIATITVTPVYTSGGITCNGTPLVFTITVNPTAKVNPVANQVVCNNSLTTAVNFTSPTSGGTIVYNWINTTPSIGLAASGSGNIAAFTATNAGTAPVVATITVTPSYTNNGVTCVGTPITFTITVNPVATVNTVANQTVCNNASTAAVTFSSPTTGGSIVYNWTNNTPSIGLAASGTGNIASFVATNATNAPVTATITVTPSYTSGGVTCTGTPMIFTITVNPTPTVNAVANQTVCNGFPTAVVTFSGAVTGTVYNWTNNTPSIGLAASGTGNIASFTAINAGLNPITATITVTPSYTNGGVTCTGTPVTFTITVNPTPTVTCPANIVVNITPNTCGAVVNYPPATATGTPAPTITYSVPSGSTFPVGTTTVVVTATNICGVATCSFTVKVIDNQAPVITCPANITVTAVGACTSVVNYAAVTATDNCPGTVITRTAGLASGSAFPLGVNTVTHTATDASGNTSTCSFTVTVLDGQIPVFTLQPANRTVCAGTTATFTATATGAVSYQWQSWNGLVWNNITGAITSTLTLTNVTQSMNGNLYRVIAVGLCTPTTSNSATLFVNPLPVVTLTASITPILLPGQLLTITAVTSPTGGSYVWFKNGVVIPGATGSSLINLTVSDIGLYHVVYTDLNGCVSTSADLAVSALASANLYVYPNPNNGHFHIRFYNQPGDVATIRIFDMRGAVVYHTEVLTTLAYTDIDIDLSDVRRITPGGIYQVEVRSGTDNHLIGSKPVVIFKF